ncbi:uncharacterized protein PWA37_002977 [Arxiozyma heterogenica]|uniref:uncharacterized protein n=1 Tax=Arxiozyma heterogenica TaxID=278026 RepID=UPI002F18FA1B
MRVLPLTFFSLLVPVVSGAFPYYDIIHLNLVALYSYFNPEKPILTNVAFWGSFIESSASTVEKAMNVCSACESDKKEPNWDCRKASLDLAKSVCLNAISLYIGWQHAGRPNGALEGADPTAMKRDIARHCQIGDTFDKECVTSWLSDQYASNIVDGWHEVSYTGLNKRDVELPNIYLRDNATDIVYHLIFNPHSESTGAVAMTQVGIWNGNNANLSKRANYPVYAPLCNAYMALDYCANQSEWGGIYKSGELENMLEEILTNDVDGSWVSDYYKMYTYEQDDKTQDWQISWRMYIASVGNNIYWSKCDTGS